MSLGDSGSRSMRSKSASRLFAQIRAGGGKTDLTGLTRAVNQAATTTYVLWGVGDDGAEPLGTFDVDGSQIELRTVGSGLTGLDDFAQYAISLEPGQEAPSAPTEVVATGQVTS